VKAEATTRAAFCIGVPIRKRSELRKASQAANARAVPLASTFAGTPCTEREVAFEGDVGTQDPFFTTVTVVPANLSLEYKAAEAAFRKSRDPRRETFPRSRSDPSRRTSTSGGEPQHEGP